MVIKNGSLCCQWSTAVALFNRDFRSVSGQAQVKCNPILAPAPRLIMSTARRYAIEHRR